MENQAKILIIDEKETSRKSLVNFLSGLAIDTEEAASFSEAIDQLRSSTQFSLALFHKSPLGDPSLTFLRGIKSLNPGLSIVLLSEIKSPNRAIALIEKGIIDHVTSPDNLAGLYSAIKNESRKRKLLQINESYQHKLHRLNLEHNKNMKRVLNLEEVQDSTLENLMTALDLRDVETFGHSRTVAKYSHILAQILGIKDKSILGNIRKGALLHDVGKIVIPDSILKKPGSLTPQEWEKIKLHPALGFSLIREIKEYEEVGNIILYHHERYEGTGYPEKLKKGQIPFEARIFSLADALDSITSDRPYRKKRDFDFAKKEIQDNSGIQFDPEVVKAFCSLSLNKWEHIRYETTKLMPSFENIIQLTKKVHRA